MIPFSETWRNTCLAIAGVNFEKNVLQREVADWWMSNDDARVCQLLGGERAGKSLLASFLMLVSMRPDYAGNYWVVGPDYRQARPEFTYLYDWLVNAGLVIQSSMPNSETSPWSMTTKWGAHIETRTGAEVSKLASFSVDGIIMAEAAQQINQGYLKLLGRISETEGFLILSGTLERGLPWYGQLYERWQGENLYNARSFSLPSWSNLEVYPGGENDPKILQLRSEYPASLFDERFAAKPDTKTGLVLKEFSMVNQVKKLTVNENLPVELAIDPGQHTYAVLFVQYDGLICNVLDRIYAKNRIAQDIIPEAMGNRLWQYIVPEDAGVIDIAGTQHHANKSQVELWKEIGGVSLYSKKRSLDDTINVLKYRFGTSNPLHMPLVYFNSHMGSGIDPDGIATDVLGEPLSWKWRDTASDQNTPKVPIDRNNDAMKALAYSLLRRYGNFVERKKLRKAKKRGGW